MTAEIQTVTATAVPAQRSYFDTLIQNADRIDGGELVKGELLERIPFAITGGHYREGDITPQGADGPSCYLSLEITIADERWLTKRRVNLDAIPFIPEDQLVFNDGSTGVKRQMTSYLHQKGFIIVRKDPEQIKQGGGKGESSFDLPPGDWDDIAPGFGNAYATESGHINFQFTLTDPLFCVRGLRPSTYSNAHAKDAVTWYLA